MEILEDKYGLWTVIDKTPIKHCKTYIEYSRTLCFSKKDSNQIRTRL